MADCEDEFQLAPSDCIHFIADCQDLSASKAQQILFRQAGTSQPVIASLVQLGNVDPPCEWIPIFAGTLVSRLPETVASIFDELAAWEEAWTTDQNIVCFETGDIKLEIQNEGRWTVVDLRNLRFSRRAIEESFANGRDLRERDMRPSKRTKRGGRPAQRHGKAIASVTLKLCKLDPAELEMQKNVSIGLMLASEYKALGHNAPNETTLANFGGQIKQAIREMRESEDWRAV